MRYDKHDASSSETVERGGERGRLVYSIGIDRGAHYAHTTLPLDLFPPPPILKTSAASDHGLLTTVETNQFVTCHACMN